MNKIIFYIVLGILVILGAFHLAFTDSFCLATTTFETALWNSYNIASEYYCARAGRNILGTQELSTNINGVSGINDGTFSEAYGEVVSSASGGVPINVNNLISLAKEVDTSNMSLSQLNALSLKIANAPWNTNGSIIMKNIAFGGISLYFAVDQAGNWLGSSYDNIVAKFSDMTVSRATSIQDKASLRYPNLSINNGYGSSMSFDGSGSAITSNGSIVLSAPVYFYGRYNNNHYNMAVLFDSDIDITSLFVYGGYSIYDSAHDIYNTYPIHSMGFSRRGTTSINGHSYYYGDITFSYINANGNLVTAVYPYLPREFHSLQSGIEFYTNRVNSNNTGYESEILDTSGVPYLVDDLGDFATTIGDLYPVIENLREVISTIPAIDELTSVISDQVKAVITEIIDGIKADALTIEETTSPDPGPIDPDVPDWFWPTFFPDLIPDDMFSMFQPVFDIVGENYSMYGVWIVIPSIIIFILILYILISVF